MKQLDVDEIQKVSWKINTNLELRKNLKNQAHS